MNWVEPADRHRLRVIGMSHESFDASVHSGRYARIKRFYRTVDLFLVLTATDARRFEWNGFNNVGVMHNPLTFYPERGSDLSTQTVIATGRYDVEKGYDRLIDAFARIAPSHRDWSLKIFGRGPLRRSLREQAKRLGLDKQVQLPGLAQDVETELLRSSIFALSSINEGLPISLGEAMACGVPSVAFDCAPGVREMVTDGEDGIVVPPLDVPALARGIERLIEDEPLRRRMGARARESARRFTKETILDRWEEIFERVER
jgi:glycosyltransferase involved in cell wall biosynthesis